MRDCVVQQKPKKTGKAATKSKSNGKAKTLGASARKSKAPKEETCSLKQLNGQMRARLSAF